MIMMSVQHSIPTTLIFLVLVDCERALSAEKVIDNLFEENITVLTFPKNLGHLMNPVELFISVAKRRYYQLLSEKSRPFDLPILDRAKLVEEAYFSVSEEAVSNFFYRVGLLGKDNPKTIMRSLIFDGARPKAKYRDMHDQQINAYLDWKGSQTENDSVE